MSFFKAPPDFRKSAHKPFHIIDPVADRNISEKIPDIAEFNLNVIIVAQYIIDLNARKPDINRIDRELGPVIVEDRIAVDKLVRKRVVIADLIDFVARILGHLGHPMKDSPAVDRKISSGNIEAGH